MAVTPPGLRGSHFLLYTTEEGGQFHTVRCTPTEYEGIVRRREVTVRLFEESVVVEPVFVALLCVVRDNHDFILGGSRDEPETWEEEYRGS